MNIFKYFLVLLVIISACKKEEKELEVILPKDYGEGMYILTDQGIYFYNYLAVDTLRIVTENIYKKVNNTEIIQPKSLHISGKQAYIIGDKLYIANMETFGSEGTISGFSNPVSCRKIDENRLYVVDKGASSVKMVDLSKLEVLGHIETGDSSRPANIVGSWFRTFVLNGGGDAFSDRDSSIVSIDYFQSGVAINDFSAKLDVGYNPNSAVFSANHLWVLCKGVYNSQDPSQNRQSTMYKIAPWSNVINDDKDLTSIYNADNLAINESKSRIFFSSTDGIYITDLTIYPILHISGIDASFITINTESINDSTNVEYLYTNDANQSGLILKYEAWTGSFVGSIQVDGNALDVVFY
jgi:hypothetical protein